MKRVAAYNNWVVDTNSNTKALYYEARDKHLSAKLKYTANKEAARIKSKNITFEKKSKHRLKLEEKYKKLGLTNEQAQAAANRRIRTEKILAASAAITVTACAAYVVDKKLKNRIDGVIKAGDTLQRIKMTNSGNRLHDEFYAAKGKHDTERYAGMLGMTRQRQTGHAYLMKLEVKNDIKVASKDKAAEIFGDLYKNDPEFKKHVENHVYRHFGGENRIKNIDDMSKRNIRKMYENFNSALIDIRNDKTGADKKFYDKLKSAGYGAIQDINDMKYSGYNAKNPLIIFDHNQDNIMVRSVEEMKNNVYLRGMNERARAKREIKTKEILELVGPMSAATLTTVATTTYASDPTRKYKTKKQK